MSFLPKEFIMSELVGLLLAFVPLLLILYIANLAEKQRATDGQSGLTVLTYAILATMYGLLIIAGLLLHLAGAIAILQPQVFAEAFGTTNGSLPFDLRSLAQIGLGLWAPSVVGIVLLLPVVRRGLARLLPGIDPLSPVHAAALSLTMLIVINLTTTLGVGLDNLAEAAAANPSQNDWTTFTVLWVQQLLMALMALLGVGWLSRRSLGAALVRLGIILPSLRQVLLGLATGVGMVLLMGLIGAAASALGVSPNQGVEDLTNALLGPLFQSPWGILTLGLAAAVGEEPLFRGAAQPRFGILLTALLFALLHSNYGITISTFVVFVLGLVLGWVRARNNTTTSMIVHAVYSICLGLLVYFSVPFLNV
jgi:uncharacterized protein